MLQEWQLLGNCSDVSVAKLYTNGLCLLLSHPGCKRRVLELKPLLYIPGSCSPSNQSGELKQKLKQGSLSPVQSKNFLLSLAQGISCSCCWV